MPTGFGRANLSVLRCCINSVQQENQGHPRAASIWNGTEKRLLKHVLRAVTSSQPLLKVFSFIVSRFSHFSVIPEYLFSAPGTANQIVPVCAILSDLPGKEGLVFPWLPIHWRCSLKCFLPEFKGLHLVFISKPGDLAVSVTFLTCQQMVVRAGEEVD